MDRCLVCRALAEGCLYRRQSRKDERFNLLLNFAAPCRLDADEKSDGVERTGVCRRGTGVITLSNDFGTPT